MYGIGKRGPRNVYIKVGHSSRVHDVGTGPLGADGSMDVTITQRTGPDSDDVMVAYEILSRPGPDNSILTVVRDGDGNAVHETVTYRDGGDDGR